MSGLFGGGGDGGAAAQLAEQKKETERMRAETATEKADLLKQQQSGLRARQRGGARALLSSERMDAEEGLKSTLGSVSGV
jgi:hypothetical protein